MQRGYRNISCIPWCLKQLYKSYRVDPLFLREFAKKVAWYYLWDFSTNHFCKQKLLRWAIRKNNVIWINLFLENFELDTFTKRLADIIITGSRQYHLRPLFNITINAKESVRKKHKKDVPF